MRHAKRVTSVGRCGSGPQLLWISCLLTGIAGLSGCALNQQADRDLASALKAYQQRTGPDADAYARVGRDAPTTQPVHDGSATGPQETSAQRPETLRDYIVMALEQNPEIKAAEEIARAKTARVPQVTALPDPRIATKTLPQPIKTAAGDNYFVLGVQQQFPVPEKLDRAGRIALQEAQMALQDLQATRLGVIADVKRAYFRLYVVDKTVGIDRTNQELLRGLIDAARAQVAAGKRSQGDVLRAQVELSTLESKLIELAQQRETAVAMLNRVLNRSPQTAVPTPTEFDLRAVNVELERLFTAAADHSPELLRLKEQIERDREAVKLAKLAYWPEFTLGFEWIQMDPRTPFQPPPNPMTGIRPTVSQLSDSGTDSWAIVFGMNIPLWFQKIDGGIREARSRMLASQHEYVSQKNRVQFEIEDALARVRAQQELAELFDSTIIPQARQAYEISRAGYAVGKSDFHFVIDNWQEWLAFTIQYHRALGELERSVADLEQAIGLSLSELP